MCLVPMHRQGDLARHVDRLFDDDFFGRFLAPVRSSDNGRRSPPPDVSESDTGYTVKLDLPGVAKDDVTISVDGNRVSVAAQITRADEQKDGDRVVYSERSVQRYARSFTLPTEVNEAESGARPEHGVLTLTLSKRGPAKTSRMRIG